MRNKLIILFAALITLCACHKESDKVSNYAFLDDMVFSRAENSFGEMFKIAWKGLNANYALWDYEKEKGLDWDKVYEDYYPRFSGLDTLKTVADEDLKKLMEEAFGPLHDGHLAIMFKNYRTGKTVMVVPGSSRVKAERGEEYDAVTGFMPILTYYAGIPGELLEYRSATKNVNLATPLNWVKAQLKALSEKTVISEEELRLQQEYSAFITELLAATDKIDVPAINRVVYKYSNLGIPGLDYVDAYQIENGIDVSYALFKGNIAYFSFSGFKLSTYLDDSYLKELWPNPTRSGLDHIESVRKVWNSWFYAIQRLHEEGKLGGVIIDIRSNGGGFINDYQYALGALLPSGGYDPIEVRFKRGTGRYDYSPIMPQYVKTYQYEHATVTEPIVVLANCRSVSMAEMTSIGTKYLDNAKLIGTRTFGGLCGLTANSAFSYNYSGHIGVEGETPVYCYTPSFASFTRDGQILEGVGVMPDIEVAFDEDAWAEGTGPDSQLDRALEYIRTGK